MRRVHLRETDSTNQRAAQLAGQWVAGGRTPGPALVSAEIQTAGRGRTGRAWRSPRGGAYFSIAYPWRGSEADAGRIPLAVGLAVRQAIVKTFDLEPDRLRVKWPNDLLLDGRKLAGVMCERVMPGVTPDQGAATADPTMHRQSSGWSPIVVGVGVNVTGPGPDAHDCRLPPIKLSEALKTEVSPARVVEACGDAVVGGLAELEQSGWGTDQAARLTDVLAWVGRAVRVSSAGPVVEGVVACVDPQGRLVIHNLSTGGETACASGELALVEVDTPA
ncbi:MAG: biotin--[acetyl-CoA-carboxylase] ligase [Planctomycetota bacterium]